MIRKVKKVLYASTSIDCVGCPTRIMPCFLLAYLGRVAVTLATSAAEYGCKWADWAACWSEVDPSLVNEDSGVCYR